VSAEEKAAGSDRRAPREDDDAVLPQIPDDERGVGWGEEPGSGRRDADWYRRERPPHHG
jgi:hypothetical protein